MTKHHQLKLNPKFFQRIIDCEKTFEIRKNDRDFQTGDTISLHAYEPDKGYIECDPIIARITYFTTAYQQEGYCVLGIRIIKKTGEIA